MAKVKEKRTKKAKAARGEIDGGYLVPRSFVGPLMIFLQFGSILTPVQKWPRAAQVSLALHLGLA